MTTTTVTDADVLDARTLAAAMQGVRLPSETIAEAAARWVADTPCEERVKVLAHHRAKIEQADADEAARVNAAAAEEQAKACAALLAEVDAACRTLQGLLEQCPSDPGHGALLVALDQRPRGEA